MRFITKIVFLFCAFACVSLTAQNQNIIDLKESYYHLNPNKQNILKKADGDKIEIPLGISFLVVLKNGNYFVSTNEKELQEVSRYENIKLLSKDFTNLPTKNKLNAYVFNISVGGLYFINTDNNTYFSVFNPVISKWNVIDQTGALIFKEDSYSHISPLFDGYASYSPDGEVKIVYNFTTKKPIVFPKNYTYSGFLPTSKLFILKNKQNNAYEIYNSRTNKFLFTVKNEIGEIKVVSDNINEETLPMYFVEYVGDNEINILDINGNVVLNGNFVVKHYHQANKTFSLDNNSKSILDRKYNFYNIETKKYRFDEFVKDFSENNFLTWYKKNEFATVIRKSNNEVLYTEKDFVKDISSQSANVYNILKNEPGQPYFYDIYSGLKNDIIFTNTKGLSYIDGTSKYFKLSLTFSSFLIIDADGNIILSERKNPSGKLVFNKGKFDVVDRKGKVKETIERDK